MDQVEMVSKVWDLIREGKIEDAKNTAEEHLPKAEADYLVELLQNRIVKPKELGFIEAEHIPILLKIFEEEGASKDFTKILKSIPENFKNEVLKNISETERLIVLSELAAEQAKLGKDDFSYLAKKVKMAIKAK